MTDTMAACRGSIPGRPSRCRFASHNAPKPASIVSMRRYFRGIVAGAKCSCACVHWVWGGNGIGSLRITGRANPCTAIARLTDFVSSSRHAVAALPPRHPSSLRVRAPHTIPVVSKHTSVNTMDALALIGGLNDIPDDDMTIREHQITA